MIRSETTSKLAAALAKAQGKFKAITKSQNAKYNTRTQGQMDYDFADLEVHLAAMRGPLSKNGIALLTPSRTEIQRGTDSEGRWFATGNAIAVVRLEHESGEWMESDPFVIPIADALDARSIGSACTYARKYAVQGFMGVHPAEEDDDGQAARGGDFEQARRPVQRQEQRQPQRAAAQGGQRQSAPVQRLQAAPREPEVHPIVDEQAQANSAANAKLLERDARDVQTRSDALAKGVKPEEYHSFCEKVLGRMIPHEAGWNRSLSDGERTMLEDAVLQIQAQPVQPKPARTNGKRAPGVDESPPKKLIPNGDGSLVPA